MDQPRLRLGRHQRMLAQGMGERPNRRHGVPRPLAGVACVHQSATLARRTIVGQGHLGTCRSGMAGEQRDGEFFGPPERQLGLRTVPHGARLGNPNQFLFSGQIHHCDGCGPRCDEGFGEGGRPPRCILASVWGRGRCRFDSGGGASDEKQHLVWGGLQRPHWVPSQGLLPGGQQDVAPTLPRQWTTWRPLRIPRRQHHAVG